MGSSILASIDAEVTRATTVQAGASALLRGFNTRMTAAVAAALDNGATAAELAPIQTEIDAFKVSTDDLAAAITENTPAADQPTT